MRLVSTSYVRRAGNVADRVEAGMPAEGHARRLSVARTQLNYTPLISTASRQREKGLSHGLLCTRTDEHGPAVALKFGLGNSKALKSLK